MYINNFSIEIDVERRLFVATGLGEISFVYSVDVMIDLVKNPEFRNDFNVIIDLRRITYHPTYDELIGIKEKLIFLKGRFKKKIALVTTELLHLVGKEVCSFFNAAGFNMKFFEDLDMAKKWIESELIQEKERE